jgi:hypothetical protein
VQQRERGRAARNCAIAILLVLFVLMFYGITIVKLARL